MIIVVALTKVCSVDFRHAASVLSDKDHAAMTEHLASVSRAKSHATWDSLIFPKGQPEPCSAG